MTHILIADGGSTKTDWALVRTGEGVVQRITTDGINALLASREDVHRVLEETRRRLNYLPSEIYYYGAGCATEQINSKMAEALESAFDGAKAFVYSDLLGAARGLFADKSGIVCILGTGSNSCLFSKGKIEHNVPSLGYILGDEGSGAALGKRLINEVFKGQLPELVKEKFLEWSGLTLPDILHKVYRCPAPNKFLASLVGFISQNIWNPYIYSLVLEEFSRFITRNVALYPGAHTLPIGCVGSISVGFEKILREAASNQGYNISHITRSPMEGLIYYHAQI